MPDQNSQANEVLQSVVTPVETPKVTPQHQTGDWEVHYEYKLVARPWNTIFWSSLRGAVPAVLVTYLVTTNLLTLKVPKAMFILPAIAGALASLQGSRKDFTYPVRNEKFIPDKK